MPDAGWIAAGGQMNETAVGVDGGSSLACMGHWVRTLAMVLEPPEAPAPPSGEPDAGQDYRAFVAGSADMNLVASVEGVYRYVSPACCRLFGWDPAELEGGLEDDFVHRDDIASVHVARAALSDVGAATMTYRFLCKDGSYRWTETTSRLVKADSSWLVVSTVRDITARQEQETVLQVQARTDPLTGLANRTVLMDRLHQGLRRMDRPSGLLAVLYLDLDRFKIINDSLGHRVGDQLLIKLAERLAHHLRPADTLARLGGDEFVIVAEGMADERAAVELANRIIEAGHQPFLLGNEEFECTVSIGIASTADSQAGAEELLREADLALYRAKDRGRDRVEVFDEELRTTVASRLVTERMLRRAIDEGRLVVEYQPIIDLTARGLVGAEALARILDGHDHLVQPSSFLEVAEETGLLIEIDERVLADAVKQASAWRDRFGGTAVAEVAINVTSRHLADAGFANSVIDALDGAGVPHGSLQVELAERTLMEASNSAITGLRTLRDAGVRVGLDDFGTGYSSLAYLRQFPLDVVKIDGSFIRDLDRSPSDRAIVAAIIGLAHALELTVVAEAVETSKQLEILEALECDRAQGYLFARSSSPDAVSELALNGLHPTPLGAGQPPPAA